MIESGIFDSASDIESFRTDTIFYFNPNKNSDFNSTGPLWLYDRGKFGRLFADMKISPSPKPELFQKTNNKTKERSIGKKRNKKKHKFKKCIYKLFKGKKKKKILKMKKRMISLFLGFLVIKSLFIPIVLKALALIAAKGFMLGLFSTVLASVFSLNVMFSHSGHRMKNPKDDGKTRVEIVHIPATDDNVYYERPFRRNIVTNHFNNKL